MGVCVEIGYARVSTDDQKLILQTDALKKAGCKKIYEDTMTGTKENRPGLDALLQNIRPGDNLVIWRLDRLGRSLHDLIKLAGRLDASNVGLVSLCESIDTTSSAGKLIFHIFGALAEFESNVIRERTNAGLAAGRARGRVGGRPYALTTKKKKMAVAMYLTQRHSAAEVCDVYKISRPTLHKYVAQFKASNKLTE